MRHLIKFNESRKDVLNIVEEIFIEILEKQDLNNIHSYATGVILVSLKRENPIYGLGERGRGLSNNFTEDDFFKRENIQYELIQDLKNCCDKLHSSIENLTLVIKNREDEIVLYIGYTDEHKNIIPFMVR